jgi:hypothetical protein
VYIAFGCAAVAICVSGYNIFKHLANYTEPSLQKNIVRILIMVPLYALFSFMALSIQEWHIFFDSVRDVYEAFVIYCFLNLILAYCGGENSCLSVIMNDPGSISHVFPLSCCFPRISLTARFLRTCKQMTLQFVIIKPVMAFLNLIIIAGNEDGTRTWDIAQAVIYNTSYTVALYGLMLFYKATCGHPGLIGQYPVLKFLTVKLVVFATYYQTVLVGIVPGIPENSLSAFNNFLLCCEMVVFSILQYFAFSWVVFANPENKRPHIGGRNDSAFEGDFNAELASRGGAQQSEKDVVATNVKDIVNVNDVAADAYYNFNNKYGNHVLLDTKSSSHGGTALGYDDEEDLETGKASKKGKKTQEDANPFQVGGIQGFGAGARVTSGSIEENRSSGIDNDYQIEIDLSKSPVGAPSPVTAKSEPTGGATLAENPFDRDMNDQLHMRRNSSSADSEDSSRGRTTSFDLNGSSAWKPDFADSTDQSTKSPKKSKKKKKSKKANDQAVALALD